MILRFGVLLFAGVEVLGLLGLVDEADEFGDPRLFFAGVHEGDLS